MGFDAVACIGESDLGVPRDATGACKRHADHGASYPDTIEA